jgi:hypothetical protein
MKIPIPVLLAAALSSAASNAVMAQDEALGRLFYTAKQRAALDANVASVISEPVKPVPIPPSVTLNGVVTRSDGERTVWIDGRAYYQGNPSDVRVITRSGDPAMAELKVKGVPQRLPVRVGQRLNPVSGETLESYETPRPSLPSAQSQPATVKSGAEPASTEPAK